MKARQLLPRRVSEETFKMLTPIIEAEALIKQEKYAEAEGKYIEILNDFPSGSGGRFLIYNKLGIVYEKLGKPDQAIETYKMGLKEGSVTPFLYQRLASLHLENGSFDEALNCCDIGIKILKRANTSFFQEVYFWFGFLNLKRRIRKLKRHGKTI